MSGREQTLSTIRRALARNRGRLEQWAGDASHVPPPFVHPPAGDLVRQLVAELERLDVKVHHRASDEAARETLRDILVAANAKTVVAWDEADVGLPGLDHLLESIGVVRAGERAPRVAGGRKAAIDEQSDAPVGITGADAAIAESGTLVLVGGAGRGRLASLLTPIHVAIIRESQIVRGLGDALMRLRSLYGDRLLADRSHVTFITGPSRTADIELTLTLGVHGPREVHVVIMRD
jgi:L-lactate dehydrogenase complex protein LldG